MFQIDNVYAKLQNYTGVQVLRVWCEGCDTPPSSGIETLYILYVIKQYFIEESGETARRKRSSSTYLETELMFNNETLLYSIIDGHKQSEVVINETLTETYSLTDTGYFPEPSKPTVCSSDLIKDLEYPDHLGKC